MKIAIVGAGFTGLSAAYYLSKKGHQVVLFEKDKFLGGLASGIKVGEWYLDRFYHHIFKSDYQIQELTEDLGLKDIWQWGKGGSPIFYQGKIYSFSTPLDLLRFSPLPFIDRLKTGACFLFLKLTRDYHYFETRKAKDWLRKWMGEKSWQVIWQPLMKKKFGQYYSQVGMIWMWARIYKRSTILGYPQGGFQVIINKLAEEIEKRKGKITLNKEIKNFSQLKSFDKAIFTGANPLFLEFAPQLPQSYKEKLKKIEYFGTVLVLLNLKKPLSNWAYWLNINDKDIPFVGCIQHTNLVDKSFYHHLHPTYLVAYTSNTSRLFKEKDKKIAQEWITHLKKINKDFRLQWVKNCQVIKEPFTQPIFKLESYQHLPEFQTPIKNLFLANMTQIYPWDRSVNNAVELGIRLAHFLKE